MKKSSKPVIFIIVLFLVLVTMVLLAVQGLRFKCEEMIRTRALLDEEIRSGKTERVSLVASYQMLTAEDLIKVYALNELKLIEGDPVPTKKIVIKDDVIKELSGKFDN